MNSSISTPQYSNKSIVFNSNTTPYPLSSFTLNPSTGFGIAFTMKYSSSMQPNSTIFFISQSNNINQNGTLISNVTNITNYFQLVYSPTAAQPSNNFIFYYQSNNINNVASNAKTTSVSFTLSTNQIYNIVITYDNTGTIPYMRAYINSELTQNSIAVPVISALPSSGTYNYNFLGGCPNYDGTYNYNIPFIGNIYSFAIYPRVLLQQDVNQCFNTDLSLSTNIISNSLANPKLSITYQLSIPNYNNTLRTNDIPKFDTTSKSIIFRGQQYLQYAENLNFSSGFTIIIKFQFNSMHIINNETLITIIQNTNLGNISTNISSVPLKNSIIIQRYGITNNLLISFIVPSGNSTSCLITKSSFFKGITYNLIVTFDGINSISVYVNGNLDNQTNLLI